MKRYLAVGHTLFIINKIIDGVRTSNKNKNNEVIDLAFQQEKGEKTDLYHYQGYGRRPK